MLFLERADDISRTRKAVDSSTWYIPKTPFDPIQPNRILMYRLLHLGDVQLDVRIDLQKLIVSRVNLVFDVLLEVGHLQQN